MDKKEFKKRWRIGVIQPELFYKPWKNDRFTIYLEKVDEFGERMSNVELRLSRTSLTNLYDDKYAYGVSNKSSYAAPLQTLPYVRITRILEDGTYNYEYEPSDFEPISYETHNFLSSPIIIENAKITKITTTYVQFIPLEQPIIISGLKTGGYRIQEVNVFDSEYFYDKNKSSIAIALDKNGKLMNIKGLQIPAYYYNQYGMDYYSELNLPNHIFEIFDDTKVQKIDVIRSDWITDCTDNLYSLVNYESLYKLYIQGHYINEIGNHSSINGGDYTIISNRDVSGVKNNNQSHKIIVDTDAKKIYYKNVTYKEIIDGFRFGSYIYHEDIPPMYAQGSYFPNSTILYYNKIPKDIEFELSKNTQKITDSKELLYYNSYLHQFSLNIYHEMPEIKFVASWVPIPQGVETTYTNYCKNTGQDYWDIISINYGNQMIGIKIYYNNQYQGYFSISFSSISIQPSKSSDSKNIIITNGYKSINKQIYYEFDETTRTYYTQRKDINSFFIADKGSNSAIDKNYFIYFSGFNSDGELIYDHINACWDYFSTGLSQIFYNLSDFHCLNETGGYIDDSYIEDKNKRGHYYYLGDGLTKETLSTFLHVANETINNSYDYYKKVICEVEN